MDQEGQGNTTEALELRRHIDLVGWYASRGRHYADPVGRMGYEEKVALTGHPFASRGGALSVLDGRPFGVSPFYEPVPLDEPTPIPPLRAAPDAEERFGEGDGETRLSVVLEGGGGKGFSYVECLRQMRTALSASREGKFVIDEYAGTSAGAITAGLLAAGYDVDTLGANLGDKLFERPTR